MAVNATDDRTRLQKALDDARVSGNPVGPPAPIPTPRPSQAPDYAGGRTVVEDATNPSDAARDPGFLRPASGPFSVDNLDPNAPLKRPTPAAPASAITTPPPIAAPASSAVPAVTRPNVAAATSIAPVLATAIAPKAPGPQVFSDGSANVPATLSRPEIDALATGPRLSRADAGIGGGIVSEAAGGTLDLGAGAGVLRRPQPVDPGAVARADVLRAQQDAASDVASIANRDPRSVLGTAARNAKVEEGSGDPRFGQNGYKDALAGLYSVATAPLATATKLAGDTIEDAGQTRRAGITADASVRGEEIRAGGTKADTVNLADGTLGIVGRDGVVRPALTPDGKPARPQVGKPPVDSAAYGKFVNEVQARFLGLDPITGMVTDRATGKQRQPTPEEITAATRGAKALADETFGAQQPGSTQPAAEEPGDFETFKKKAKALNPNASDEQLKDYYTKTYGR